jgi:hypothetical protein
MDHEKLDHSIILKILADVEFLERVVRLSIIYRKRGP